MPRFPGVDPYLESQHFWPDFHTRFITYACDVIADRLPRGYAAQIDERIVLVEPSGDRSATARSHLAVERYAPHTDVASRQATLTLEPVTIPFEELEEVRKTRVEILRWPARQLIAVLELLSPANKVEPGFSAYRAKRVALLGQKVHLIELDLLLGGRRLPMRCPLPPGDYFALVGRADRFPDCQAYHWSIRHPLPMIPVPLHGADADIHLDLAYVYATAHERGRYSQLIDYQAPLEVALDPEDRAWAEALARAPAG